LDFFDFITSLKKVFIIITNIKNNLIYLIQINKQKSKTKNNNNAIFEFKNSKNGRIILIYY
jgi:hypothetical protein